MGEYSGLCFSLPPSRKTSTCSAWSLVIVLPPWRISCCCPQSFYGLWLIKPAPLLLMVSPHLCWEVPPGTWSLWQSLLMFSRRAEGHWGQETLSHHSHMTAMGCWQWAGHSGCRHRSLFSEPRNISEVFMSYHAPELWSGLIIILISS